MSRKDVATTFFRNPPPVSPDRIRGPLFLLPATHRRDPPAASSVTSPRRACSVCLSSPAVCSVALPRAGRLVLLTSPHQSDFNEERRSRGNGFPFLRPCAKRATCQLRWRCSCPRARRKEWRSPSVASTLDTACDWRPPRQLAHRGRRRRPALAWFRRLPGGLTSGIKVTRRPS